ncbi:hypothetical protein pEaSNUABM37_00064 [Erwinia phage pEa_SNUABM_37]|nr:hypothetical protein pEaSNUABM37_00064 [Erwinia phage pEa_SNUABM_37]QXO10534.1 hypothetical protein pEaSNUABM48_00064 [Erwinia phage pEa_SNUABM_48]
MVNDISIHDPLPPELRMEAEYLVSQIICPITNAIEMYTARFDGVLESLAMLLICERHAAVDAFLHVCDEHALSGAAAYLILDKTRPRKEFLSNWERCNEKWHRLYVQNIRACQTLAEMLEVSRAQGRIL